MGDGIDFKVISRERSTSGAVVAFSPSVHPGFAERRKVSAILVQLVFRAELNSLACISAGSREASFIYVILDIRNRGSYAE